MNSNKIITPPANDEIALPQNKNNANTTQSQEDCFIVIECCANPFCKNVNTEQFQKCTGCGLVTYCDKSCQKMHWKTHKKLCTSAAKYRGCKNMKDFHKAVLVRFSNEIPPIAVEYSSRFGEDKVYTGYLEYAAKSIQEMVDSNIKNLDPPAGTLGQGDILRRWGYIGPELAPFIKGNEAGKVFETKPYLKYHQNAPQQFRNAPLGEPTKLLNGTTLVDIGFVDFGIALDSIETLDADPLKGPLKVIGYEIEPLCVAKSLVMLQMMRNEAVRSRSVVEVWLSSLWSTDTHTAFRTALTVVLSTLRTIYPKSVIDILQFWAAAGAISQHAALEYQLENVLRESDIQAVAKASNFTSDQNRVDFLRYHRTKALYEDSTTTVGSIVMNCECDAIGIRQHFGNCTEAVPTYALTAYFKPDNRDDPSFFNRIRCYFEKRIAKFSQHLRRGSLLFTPKLGHISLDNKALLEEIKKANPFVISWSNLCDYMEPKEFHTIAKKVAGPDSVHYLHSCLWMQRVYGTDIHEIDESLRLIHYSIGLLRIEKCHELLIGVRRQGVYHVRDVCASQLARQYVKNYFRYFFREQQVACGSFNGKTPLKMVSPFTREINTAYFMFAYRDAGITFRSDNYNFLLGEDAT
jgi:hypothetical protein